MAGGGGRLHVQPAVDKPLRAGGRYVGGPPERTRGLSDLALMAAERRATQARLFFLTDQAGLAELGKHAVQPRYTQAPPVSEAEARGAVATSARRAVNVAAIVDHRS